MVERDSNEARLVGRGACEQVRVYGAELQLLLPRSRDIREHCSLIGVVTVTIAGSNETSCQRADIPGVP